MKKKLVTGALLCAFGAVAVTGGTLAYFTDKDAKTNEFTVGNVDIQLVEEAWDRTGKAEAVDIYPGEALAKDPVVKNVGENPCFVRVQVTGLDQFGDKGAITLRHGNYEAGYDDTNWAYNEVDGYYYYKGVLAVGDETPALFNQVVMPTGLVGTNNDATEDDLKTIDVKAEAVQAQGARPRFSAVEAMTVEEIAAWFGTAMPAPVDPAPAE